MFVESVEALHERLRAYVEAVYHVADTGILEQRRDLLARDGVIRQPAFIESTRQYAKGDEYAEILKDAPGALLALAKALSKRPAPLLHDPPYVHQGEALRALLIDRKDIVVFTGTGSGKTECFTVPILFRLLREAATARRSFEQRAVRAIVLYPMNALVNDQLSRVRRLLGDEDVARAFVETGGRPVTFGQYTGRTPFAGVRQFTAEFDGRRIESFARFFIDTVLAPSLDGDEDALRLRRALGERGRWPSKPDLLRWYGSGLWKNRLHPHADDRELIARHEFYGYVAPDGRRHGAPPDVLITNYSMLEYMLMRPIERPIFDRTRALDEAHLYRGAQGTEVALLIRRLRERLGLAGAAREAQLRVAVTSASFSAREKAQAFAAELVGRASVMFVPLGGRLALSDAGAPGDGRVARALAAADLRAFYRGGDTSARLAAIREAIEACTDAAVETAPESDEALAKLVHDALVDHPLRRRLVALTQEEALQVPELAERLFPGVDPSVARGATEALAALCAFAKPSAGASNLLPSRIHTFHRGLPGLWACSDPSCSATRDRPGSVSGALYGQPRDACEHCGARVFAFYTCRSCGAAYLRAACASGEWKAPRFLWNAVPVQVGGSPAVLPVDVLLEVGQKRAEPTLTEVAWLDPRTGAVLPAAGEGLRQVGLYRVDPKRGEPVDQVDGGRRFYRCGVCGDDNDIRRDKSVVRRSPVEDHQTEGQDPFYALVHEQLMRQPARVRPPAFLKRETPLAGRKVLIFSDGRQKAARLAAELGRAALWDGVRPLVLQGYRVAPKLPLRHIYAALLLGAASSEVELRATDERFDDDLRRHVAVAREAIDGDLDDELLGEVRDCKPPAPVATLLLRVLRDKHTGLQALALARVAPSGKATKKKVDAFPKLAGLSAAHATGLLSLWLGEFVERHGCTTFDADGLEDGFRWLAASAASGAFDGVVAAVAAACGDTEAKRFKGEWLAQARNAFRSDGDDEDADKISLNASRVALEPCDDEALASWGRCDRCSRVQAAILPGAACVHCGAAHTVQPLAPGSAGRQRFMARKGFYRAGAVDPASSRVRPLVAREHSAALTGVAGDAQSRAERHELAFQDITAPTIDGMRSAIDVLSCTTTMEVGIDIGDLAAVALRNMPPGRANYQQRAGRAGRRGNAVATVLAYADQDGHNQHFFENPRQLIKAPVPDPTLNLENPRIAQRHVNAFVLQQFLAEVVPSSDAPDARTANLFASLGTVDEFLSRSTPLNVDALRDWLGDDRKVAEVRAALDRWLPQQIRNRDEILDGFPAALLASVERALDVSADAPASEGDEGAAAQQEDLDSEDAPENSRSLLERMLYEGVLPKYAFPTDLVAFHVFEATNGLNAKPTEVRRRLRYAPQRGLSLALSEYAPGRTVFIDGRLWMSGGLYSPVPGGLARAFEDERYFRACGVCGYACLSDDAAPTKTPCRSCGDPGFGEAVGTKWIRPPGFAHPVTFRPRTEPDAAQYSRPGRAILWAPSPAQDLWGTVQGREGVSWHLGLSEDWEVVVTNRGPRDQGFRVCRACGAIEPATEGRLSGATHRAPVPNEMGFSDECKAVALDTVSLGTHFRTDVLLLRFELPAGQSLAPRVGGGIFQMALSSLATALSLAASLVLEVESGEVVAGYRASFTKDGPIEDAVEVFLYDQLAGGAGYVVELSRKVDDLLKATRAILAHEGWNGRTPQPPCDRACYGCLLSFKNSYEHASLDRRLALDLLDAASTGASATLGEERSQSGYGLIERWLRLLTAGEVLRDVPLADEAGALRVPLAVRRKDGVLVVPALAHPFSAATPDDSALRDLLAFGMGSPALVVPLDYLAVTRALPVAMEQLRGQLDV